MTCDYCGIVILDESWKHFCSALCASKGYNLLILELELTRLQKAHPCEKFRITFCNQANEDVIQIHCNGNEWLCLHEA